MPRPAYFRAFLPRYALAVLAAAGVALAAACGGAAKQDVLDSDPVPATSSTSTSGGNTSGGNTSGGNTSGGNTSGGTVDASPPDAMPACPQETEPNDSRNTANTLAPTLCGSAMDGESDFLTFQLPESATGLQLDFMGQVTLKVDVNNMTVTLGNGEFPKVPFVKGKRYVVEIKAVSKAANVPWRVDLIEK